MLSLFLIAKMVTTSKALVTTSDALVTTKAFSLQPQRRSICEEATTINLHRPSLPRDDGGHRY